MIERPTPRSGDIFRMSHFSLIRRLNRNGQVNVTTWHPQWLRREQWREGAHLCPTSVNFPPYLRASLFYSTIPTKAVIASGLGSFPYRGRPGMKRILLRISSTYIIYIHFFRRAHFSVSYYSALWVVRWNVFHLDNGKQYCGENTIPISTAISKNYIRSHIFI